MAPFVVREARKIGLRFLTQEAPFLRTLEDHRKLVRPSASQSGFLRQEERRLFHGVGHGDSLADDIPLYAAARVFDRIVITRDEHLLAKQDYLRRHLDVATLSVLEAIGEESA